MANTFETGFRTTLAAALTPAATTATLATVPTVTKGRLLIQSGTLKEWVSYTGVSGSTVTGLTRDLSQTANPATAGTGLSWVAGTSVILVAMHDQLIDKQEGTQVQGFTAAQRTALSIPAGQSAIVLNTDSGVLEQWIGGSWQTFATGTTPNASETVAGKVEQATAAEQGASTEFGGTGAPLFVNPKNLRKTSSGAADENMVPVLDASGSSNSFLKPNAMTEKTSLANADQFVIADSAASNTNKKVLYSTLRNSVAKFGGTGGDGAVDGTGNVTITGSNNTIIEKNYSTWAAGSAPRTVTTTPTGCINYIRIQGDADFTNWTFNYDGKGQTSGSTTFFPSTAGGVGTQSGTGTGGGGGGGASCTTSGSAGTAGGGGTSGGAGGTTSASFSTSLFPVLKRDYLVDCGSPGGNGIQSGGSTGGLGGAGGGCLIIEVGGNLTLGSCTINARGADGTVVSSGGGGGGGGSVIIFYAGTLTGSATINVNGGAGGTGTGGNGSGGAGGAGVTDTAKNSYYA